MRAGMLTTRVHILAPATTVDALGQPTEAWTLAQTVWADARYPTGLQSLSADRLNSGARASLRVRQTSCTKAITPAMRAVIGGTAVGTTVTGGTAYKIMDCPRQGRDAIDLVCEAV